MLCVCVCVSHMNESRHAFLWSTHASIASCILVSHKNECVCVSHKNVCVSHKNESRHPFL